MRRNAAQRGAPSVIGGLTNVSIRNCAIHYFSDTEQCRLFNSTEHSDCIIRLGNREWPAHRLVLKLHSTFFNKALAEGVYQVSNLVMDVKIQHQLVTC